MEIPNAMKIVIALMIIIAMGFGFYILQWKEPLESAKASEAELVKIAAELETVEKQKEEIPRLRTQIIDAERELQEVIQQELTPESEADFIPSYMADVERLVEHQRMRMQDPDFILNTIRPDTGKKSSAPSSLASYPVKNFDMTLTGRYATIIDFLRQLGALKLKRLVTVNEITLSGSVSKDNYTASPVLTISLPLSVYLRKDG